MDDEVWLPIKGYEGYYEVSSLGRVRSLPRVVTLSNGVKRPTPGKVLKQSAYGRGYKAVGLTKNNVPDKRSVHRLVAEAFVPNDEGLPEVNHIDEDKHNNRADNLEWCDRRYNNAYGTTKMRAAASSGKPVLQKSLDDGHIINAWATEGLAAAFTGATQSGISMCCRGESKSSGGFAWEWAPWSGH